MKKRITSILFLAVLVLNQVHIVSGDGRGGGGFARGAAHTRGDAFGATGTTQFSAVSPRGVNLTSQQYGAAQPNFYSLGQRSPQQIYNQRGAVRRNQNSYNQKDHSELQRDYLHNNYNGHNWNWWRQNNPTVFYNYFPSSFYQDNGFYPAADYDYYTNDANSYQSVYQQNTQNPVIFENSSTAAPNPLAQQLYPNKDACIRACLDMTVDTLQSCLVQCGAY